MKIVDLKKQLMDKYARIEHVQENNVEYLQQENKCLQEKFTDHRRIEELETENAALTAQIKELQESCGRL
jgi:hypothetical protein